MPGVGLARGGLVRRLCLAPSLLLLASLLDWGAAGDGRFGRTAFHRAAKPESPAMLRALLATGAKLEARTKPVQPPPHLAVMAGSRVDREAGKQERG